VQCSFPFSNIFGPIGDFYIALLKICVLPFLLSTIPLAVRSAMGSGSAAATLRSLVIWVVITMAAVAIVTVGVTGLIFHYASVDEQMIAKIGALVGQSADGIDVEFAIDPSHDPQSTGSGETGIFSVIPTNIFAALSSNDSVRVLIFAIIFGTGMVMTERQSGHSIFGALRHLQAVCITIFDWFSLLVPIGIVALIAPQVGCWGQMLLLFLGCLATHFWQRAFCSCRSPYWFLRYRCMRHPVAVFAALLKPIMLGASTRNTLICIPIAVEALKDDLKIKREICDLFVPLGFATIRFRTIVYFIVATAFVGTLMGRPFGLADLGLVAHLR
jgi:proton glutamate symport protein